MFAKCPNRQEIESVRRAARSVFDLAKRGTKARDKASSALSATHRAERYLNRSEMRPEGDLLIEDDCDTSASELRRASKLVAKARKKLKKR